MEYRPGKFFAAMRANASSENEQNVFTLSTDAGEMVFKQIAGLIARRVVSWKKAGRLVARGERIGLVRFGSRVDLWVPREAEIMVKVGAERQRRIVRSGAAGQLKKDDSANGSQALPMRIQSKPEGALSASIMHNQQQQMTFVRKRRITNPRLRRGIFLLPSLFTVANLLCGYYAVVASLVGGADEFDRAAKAIGLAHSVRFHGRPRRAHDRHEYGIWGTAGFAGGRVQLRNCSGGDGIRLGRSQPDGSWRNSLRQLSEFGWVCCLAFLVCCAWRLAQIQCARHGAGKLKVFCGHAHSSRCGGDRLVGARIQRSAA